MRKATSFSQPMKFTGTYPSNWAGYTFLQPRTSEGHPELRHVGIDYNYGAGNQDIGMDALCVANGTVEKVIKWDGSAGYGNHVFVRHELSEKLKSKYGCDIVYSHYAHLNDVVCQEGSDINKGDLIGHVGNSGTQFGHLHLEIKKPTGLGYESYPSDKPEEWLRQYYFDPYLFVEENKTEDPDTEALLEACQLQVQDEIKKKNETYQELQDTKSELAGALDQASSAKKETNDLLQELSTALGVSTDKTIIIGQIGKLIKEEEQLAAAQKAESQAEQQFHGSQLELTDIKQKYDQLVVANQEEVKTSSELRKELDVEKTKNDDLTKQLTAAQTAATLRIVGKLFGYYIAVKTT